jgi:hypothetical protein
MIQATQYVVRDLPGSCHAFGFGYIIGVEDIVVFLVRPSGFNSNLPG